LIRLQTSTCIFYGLHAFDIDSFRKLLRYFLPTKHLSHNWFGCIIDGRQWLSTVFEGETMFGGIDMEGLGVTRDGGECCLISQVHES
jgi:hypothetical protein